MPGRKLAAVVSVSVVIFAAFTLSACLRENLPVLQAGTGGDWASLAIDQVPAAGRQFRVTGGRVYDGDTFEFRHLGQVYRVRLAGIDAPERTQPYADQARKALKAQVEGQEVLLDILKLDVYKRFVARVQVMSGRGPRDVSLEMLDQGLAWHFKRYLRDQSPAEQIEYARVENRARELQRGLWKDEAPLAPWLFREQHRRRRVR